MPFRTKSCKLMLSNMLKMTFDGKTATLVITSTYEEDTGRFVCRATNNAGQVETSALLTVKRKH